MTTSYSTSIRAAKEKFVTGHAGTSLVVIDVLLVSMPVLCFTSYVVGEVVMGSERGTRFLVVGWEFMTIVIPTLLLYTVWMEYAMLVVSITLMIGVLTLLLLVPKRQTAAVSSHNDLLITMLRGEAVLSTALAILAVDFNIFPRSLCKAEHYGHGLMDIGVGAFVLTGAIVQKRRTHQHQHSVVWILLVLGFARMLSVKSIDYQEHTSEYGVHWNFFFTLAIVRLCGDMTVNILSKVLKRPVPGVHLLATGLCMLVVHQTLLSRFGMAEIIMDDGPRHGTSLLWQNKEGICSMLGYTALHLCCQGMAWMLRYDGLGGSNDLAPWIMPLFGFMEIWMFLMLTQLYVEPVSRRSANAAFVFWIAGCGILILTSFAFFAWLLVRVRGGGSPSSVILTAMSDNQLAVFLLSNLLTGAVNLSIDTMAATPMQSLIILSTYAFMVCGIALYMPNVVSLFRRCLS